MLFPEKIKKIVSNIMNSCLQNIHDLYTTLKNLLRLFSEARQYIDMEVVTDEKSFTLPLMPFDEFLNWILTHKKPMMHSLHIVGKNIDATKTIRTHFLLSELPFTTKDIGVNMLRNILNTIHEVHEQDKIGISTSFGDGQTTMYLPRETEVTLVTLNSLTPDANKYLNEFKLNHRRITLVKLSMNKHLRCYLLDHPFMPKLRRLNKEETKKNTPKPPIQCNELCEDSVEVMLIGGVPGDMIESTLPMKTGVNLIQYWKIIPQIKKK